MSLQVQIMTAGIAVRSIPARDGRAAMHFNEQKAAILRPNDFPLPFSITLEDGQQPYAPGIYEFHPDSIVLGKYSLEFARRIKLVPAPAAAVKAA